AREVPRFRAAAFRAPRPASQRRHPVPHLRTRTPEPALLRDPVARRRGIALPHRLALSLPALLALPAHPGARVVAHARDREGPLLPGADQRRNRAGVREAGEPGGRAHRVAGPRPRPLDRVQGHPREAAVIRTGSRWPPREAASGWVPRVRTA